MKKSAMLFALLITFSLAVVAQDSSKPANGASTPESTATSPAKHVKMHHAKHHKATKTHATDAAKRQPTIRDTTAKTATDATKTPAENTPSGK